MLVVQKLSTLIKESFVSKMLMFDVRDFGQFAFHPYRITIISYVNLPNVDVMVFL